MANKITIKEQFVMVNEVLRAAGRDDLVEFIDGRIAQAEKKSSAKKPTKTQVENESYKQAILTLLAGSKGMTATEILNAGVANGDFPAGTSNQKVTTLVSQMVKAERVIRNQDGKKVIFTLPNIAEEGEE